MRAAGVLAGPCQGLCRCPIFPIKETYMTAYSDKNLAETIPGGDYSGHASDTVLDTTERIAVAAQRWAKIIWRHSPTLRSSIERDDWLQEAVTKALSRKEPLTDKQVRNSARQLAKRIIEKSVSAVSLPNDFNEFPERTADNTPAFRIDLYHLPKSYRKHSGHRGSRHIRITAKRIALLMQKGYPVTRIAELLGISIQNVYYWIHKMKAESINK